MLRKEEFAGWGCSHQEALTVKSLTPRASGWKPLVIRVVVEIVVVGLQRVRVRCSKFFLASWQNSLPQLASVGGGDNARPVTRPNDKEQ